MEQNVPIGAFIMDKEIQLALAREADFSKSFDQKMESLRDLFTKAINAPVYLDIDMNYNASQRLYTFLDHNQQGCDKDSDESAIKFSLLVSSKGPFYTYLCSYKVGRNKWEQGNISPESNNLNIVIRQAEAVLQKEGHKGLFGDILEELALGYTTNLEGKPATIFEVLFSEIW